MEPCEGVDEEAWAPCEPGLSLASPPRGGVKVEKPAAGMTAEAPSYDTQGWVS